MATNADLRFITPDEFLLMDFGEMKAELDNGVIRMMAGGSGEHNRVQMNFYGWFRQALRGSGCRPYGSDAKVRTIGWSMRMPDVTVDCAPDRGRFGEAVKMALEAPRVIIEILSPGTRAVDEGIKLTEYRQTDGVDTIVYVDPLAETVRLLYSPFPGEWSDQTFVEPTDLELRSLGLVMPWAEIFARD